MKRRRALFAITFVITLVFEAIPIEGVYANFIGSYLPRLLIQPGGRISPL